MGILNYNKIFDIDILNLETGCNKNPCRFLSRGVVHDFTKMADSSKWILNYFIGGGYGSAQRKQPTCRKLLVSIAFATVYINKICSHYKNGNIQKYENNQYQICNRCFSLFYKVSLPF